MLEFLTVCLYLGLAAYYLLQYWRTAFVDGVPDWVPIGNLSFVIVLYAIAVSTGAQ